jgi:glycerol kinase
VSHILALDQGTSSSRSIVFDERGHIVAMAQREFRQIYPQPGWVEHDPMEIWESQWATARQALAEAGLEARQLRAIGITNQRETTVVWNRRTGEPLHRAIVWQDRRAEGICGAWREAGLEPQVRQRTGLRLDPYFSAASCAGCSTMCPPCARRPPAASWPSARWTAGCCGSSPAGGCMPPT